MTNKTQPEAAHPSSIYEVGGSRYLRLTPAVRDYLSVTTDTQRIKLQTEHDEEHGTHLTAWNPDLQDEPVYDRSKPVFDGNIFRNGGSVYALLDPHLCRFMEVTDGTKPLIIEDNGKYGEFIVIRNPDKSD